MVSSLGFTLKQSRLRRGVYDVQLQIFRFDGFQRVDLVSCTAEVRHVKLATRHVAIVSRISG